MSLLRWLGFGGAAGSPDVDDSTESVRQIAEKLAHLPRERARYLAAFAYVLSRVAHADMDVSEGEIEAMRGILVERGDLPADEAEMVVELAVHRASAFGATENYVVTREFASLATREQKLALIDCLFAVSAADEHVTTIESNVIRQIASEIGLAHRDYATVRSRYRDVLGELKPDV